MIIFDLDGTLADCEHRRHFVDPSKRDDCYYHSLSDLNQMEGWYYKDIFKMCEPPKPMKFIPDWKSFYEACDKDEPILSTITIFRTLMGSNVQIWSARCESTRDKTNKWIQNNICYGTHVDSKGTVNLFDHKDIHLKMRPIGDNTPDEQLKERWLDEYYASLYPKLDKDAVEGTTLHRKDPIEFVFDDRKKVRDMWIRRGIFVFDVSQGKGDF